MKKITFFLAFLLANAALIAQVPVSSSKNNRIARVSLSGKITNG